jgi:predicted O-methyltransferase YrrM
MGLLSRIFKAPVKKVSPDDFIRRLRSSVIGEGMLEEGNIYLFDKAIRQLPAIGAVVEIGSYGGLSANLICHLLRKYKKQNSFFTCDPWIYEGYHDHKGGKTEFMDGRDDVKRLDHMEHIRQSFIRSSQLLSKANLPHSIHSTSNDFFSKWERTEEVNDVFERKVKLGGPIAFAYIDGDHSYEAAEQDLENVTKYLIRGGLILLDDSADHLSFGSARLMKKVARDKRFSIEDRNPNYLIRKT